tara:strand:- start:2839 stop:3228 length:390 start_codon:yes stop_codon:yes gene_type:complete
MRTTRKEVKNAVQAHILDCVNCEDFEIEDTEHEKVKLIRDEFNRVAVYPHNLHRFKNYQGCFTDYLNGAPMHFLIYNHEILEEMENNWHLPQPENKDISDSVNLYHYLIFRELNTLLKRHDLELIVRRT